MARIDTIRIALTFADDTLGFMSFVTREYLEDGSIRWENAPTEVNIDKVIAQLEGRNEPDPNKIALAAEKRPVKSWRLIREEDIPEKDAYRNALRDTGKVFQHDMPSARTLHKELLRAARAPELAALDIAYQRADEDGLPEAKQAVRERKQILRDCTDDPRIEAAVSVEDLKAVTLPE